MDEKERLASDAGSDEKRDKKKSNKDQKKEHRSLGAVLKNTWGIYKGEFDKIVWPKRDELVKEVVVVIVTSLMVGAIIAGMDYFFNYLYTLIPYNNITG